MSLKLCDPENEERVQCVQESAYTYLPHPVHMHIVK